MPIDEPYSGKRPNRPTSPLNLLAGHSSDPLNAWQEYSTMLMAWAQVGDETYCRYLQTIFADSAQSLEQLIGKLTEKQVSIDGILAQALLASVEQKYM